MSLPIVLSALLCSLSVGAGSNGVNQTPPPAGAEAAPAPVQAPSFQTAMVVAEPVRLALTPKIDGVLQDEEWDPLVVSPTFKGYFQWEPGKLHFAGVVPNGNDLLISIDFGSNGWLVGNDNVEVRVTNSGAGPTFTVRQMDGTQVSGPRWIDLPGMTAASTVAAKSDAVNTTYEFTLDDAGMGICPMLPNGRLSLRMDPIPSTNPPLDPFLPRILSPLQLAYTRAAALPTGLKFGVEGAGVYVPPGEGTRLRFTFKGTDKMNLSRLALRGEGFAHELTETAVPFPPFDDKGRAFVDYNTSIPRDASMGFRIVRGTLTGGDGIPGLIEASLRVAPTLDVSLVRLPIRSRPQAQTVHLAYYIRSNSGHRITGESSVSAPPAVTLTRPEDDKFTIDSPRSSVRMGFDLLIPAGTRGAIPLTFKVMSGGQEMDSVRYINVQ